MGSPVRTVDVAHPPMKSDSVEELLIDAFASVRNTPGEELLKIVHGYGSSGTGGSTKEVVRNWLYRQRGRCHAVIPGEEYSLHHEAVQEIRSALGPFDDADLGMANPGITVAWVRK